MPYGLVKLRSGHGFCSGVRIAPNFVLSAKHFLRHALPRDIQISAPCDTGHSACEIAGWIGIPHTDIAVVKAPLAGTPGFADVAVVPLSSRSLRLADRVISVGLGSGTPDIKPGRVLGVLPFALGKNIHTRVRHAALLAQRHPAIRGDSGGPILIDGAVYALQSMILEPFGRNIGCATVAQVAPVAQKIHSAMNQLQRRHA